MARDPDSPNVVERGGYSESGGGPTSDTTAFVSGMSAGNQPAEGAFDRAQDSARTAPGAWIARDKLAQARPAPPPAPARPPRAAVLGLLLVVAVVVVAGALAYGSRATEPPPPAAPDTPPEAAAPPEGQLVPIEKAPRRGTRPAPRATRPARSPDIPPPSSEDAASP